ncbi:DUF6090 family protein [Aegicerativicinus sediminis]|uniref:DUF6090 family protein n=1 Tax=Aegicerativicinus sediminis TaxID=2893202 RepID=UPI001E40CF43|nr:DUF6090 family protein [Aegicerativicinus sediminis]
MIKFFRKFRQKLLTENKFSKYLVYAIGEIVLVVIGILIALSINNWNQKRINSLSESLLLKEINTEFKFNKKELESTIITYTLVRNHCNYLRKSFPLVQNEIDKDSLSRALGQLRNLGSADLSMGSISTLINTSSFEIISNTELRTLLIQWDDLISDYFEREEQTINYTRHTIIPYLAKRIPQPYIKGLDDDRVDLSFLNSIEFENLINDRHRDVNTLLNVVENEDDEIRKAINRIIFLSNSGKE